jgi:hypothetical protein
VEVGHTRTRLRPDRAGDGPEDHDLTPRSEAVATPRPIPSVRLIGGPRVLDGRLWPHDAPTTRLLIAVHQSRTCSLDDLRGHCTDRTAAEEIATRWLVAGYSPSGRSRRVRAPLFRYESTFTLVAGRDRRGGWTVEPGPPSLVPPTVSPPTSAPSTGGDPSIWSELEDGVDRAAQRFTRVAVLLPDGPLAERARATQAAVDTSVADAARLCAVGASIAPEWQPGGAGDEAAALVARVTALVGTIDEATVELVRLHLELGEASVPAESLALLADAVAELDAGHHRGDQDDVRNNRDRH